MIAVYEGMISVIAYERLLGRGEPKVLSVCSQSS